MAEEREPGPGGPGADDTTPPEGPAGQPVAPASGGYLTPTGDAQSGGQLAPQSPGPLAHPGGPPAPPVLPAGPPSPPAEVAPGPPGRRRNLAVIILALLVLVAAIVALPHFVSKSSSGGSAPQLATASLRSFPATLTATGTVVPSSEVAVNFSSAGRIDSIPVQVGQHVAAGAVLATIDNPGPASDLARAQSAVAAANQQLSEAQQPLDPVRAGQLQQAIQSAQSALAQAQATASATATQDANVVAVDKKQLASDQQRTASDGCSQTAPSNALVCQTDQSAITTDEGQLSIAEGRQSSDASQDSQRVAAAAAQVSSATSAYQTASTPSATQVQAAEAAVNAANGQLQAAQAEVAALSLTAPSAGTVFQINGQVGETVSGAATGAATLPGTTAPIPEPVGAAATAGQQSEPLIVLGNNGSYVVGAAFPSAEAAQLSPGQQGTLTATTLTGLSIPCHVLAVAQQTTTVNGEPATYVSVVPDGPTTALSASETVSVDIVTSQATNVLAVPQSAIYTLSGIPHVDVWTGRRSVSTPVTTGLEGTILVQVTSGLTAGQQVVLSAYQGLPASGSAPASSSP